MLLLPLGLHPCQGIGGCSWGGCGYPRMGRGVPSLQWGMQTPQSCWGGVGKEMGAGSSACIPCTALEAWIPAAGGPPFSAPLPRAAVAALPALLPRRPPYAVPVALSSEIPAISRLRRCKWDVSEQISSPLGREKSTGAGHRACSLGCPCGGTGMGMSARMVGQDGIPSLTPGQGSLSGLFTIVPRLWDRCLSPLRAEAQCYLIWKPALPQPCPSHEASVGGVPLQ